MLEEFEPGELITFGDSCPQKVEAATGEMQNQENPAMFSRCRTHSKPEVAVKWKAAALPLPPTSLYLHTLPAQPHKGKKSVRS